MIDISISEATLLGDSRVARALMELIAALGGVDPTATPQPPPTEPRTVKARPAPKPPQAEPPQAEPEPPQAAPEPAPQPTPAPAPTPKPTRAKAPEPRPKAPTMPWSAFEETLTDVQRRFLALIEARGQLTLQEAAEALGKESRGVGGVTGALQRSALRVGLQVPYRQGNDASGGRVWVWAAAPARPQKPKAPKAPPPEVESPKPEAPPPAAEAPAGKPPAGPSWAAFRETLSPDTNRFIDLIVQQKTLTLAAAMEALGKTNGKQIAGITGALARKAKSHGVPLPFSAGENDQGERIWVLAPKVLAKLSR